MINNSHKRIYFILSLPICLLLACNSLPSLNLPNALSSDPKLLTLIETLAFCDKNNIDAPTSQKAFNNLSPAQIKTLLDHLSILEKKFTNTTPLLKIIALNKQYSDPQKALDLIAQWGNQSQNLYVEYTQIFKNWLKSDPRKAKNYILNQTPNYPREAENMANDLQKTLVAYLLKHNIDETFEWMDSLKEADKKQIISRALLTVISNDYRIYYFANWLSTQTYSPPLKTTLEYFIPLFTEADPIGAMQWANERMKGQAKQTAIKELFYNFGLSYPFIGAQWFNNGSNRLELEKTIKKQTKHHDSFQHNNFITAFVKGLMDNKETDIHPSEIVSVITDPFYQPLVMAAYQKAFNSRK